MVITDLKVKINREDVFCQIDCHKDSPIYEEVLAEYYEMEDEIYSLCRPIFLLEYDVLGTNLTQEHIPEGTSVFFALYSIGGEVSDYATKAFEEGDYLKGMLADAMADSALFSLEKEIVPYLKEACADKQRGISRRLEAPRDISMEAQKIIFEKTKAEERCGMKISSGYMIDPVKSNALIYVLAKDQELFLHQHNCRTCERYDCKQRNVSPVPVKVSAGEHTYFLNVKEQESILDALIAKNASFGAVCGGNGKCGKCKIQITEGYLPVTVFDAERFSKDELTFGMRLSCKAYPQEPVAVTLDFKCEEAFQIVSDCEPLSFGNKSGSEEGETFGIAVDIGTTTIAMQLLSLKNGEKYAVHTGINHQRQFGADVICRIKASVEGKREELRKSIQQDLKNGFQDLVKKSGILPEKVTEIAIAGNTTMGHLLMGYDCRGLGVFPFTPVNLQLIEESYETIFGDTFFHARVRLLPGISTFVGGDIVAGLYTCDVDQKKEYSLLIDLGTNGEIVLGNAKKLLATSTAAGPAFEGGNITWGVGSIEGAIAGVQIKDGKPQIHTIGDKEAIGICGTGAVEAVAELVKAELIDETGCLEETYFEEGYPLAKRSDGKEIVLTQKDIREIQLAKAAVRAGIETLILRYGIPKDEIAHVYLAGGFGFGLDCKKAIALGMIPEEFCNKIEAVGNSSLGGAAKCLLTEKSWNRVCRIAECTEEINLSADKDFNQLYMEHMYF